LRVVSGAANSSRRAFFLRPSKSPVFIRLSERRDISRTGVFHNYQQQAPNQRSGKRFEEDFMQWHKSVLKSVFGKAALAAAALGGFMFFGGASSAQAAPVYVYHRPVVVVHRGYYAPVPYWRHEYVRGWYDRFGCWHRY
jgi:hypothetical protein